MRKYDTIVIGGGTAGIVAAVSAAKEGLNVLIIEREYTLGGTQTNSLVTPMMSLRIKGINGASSISQEITNAYTQKYGFFGYTNELKNKFDPILLSFILDDLVLKYGIDVVFGATLDEVVVRNDEINYLTIVTPKEKIKISALNYIDATGNADLGYKLGICNELRYGDREHNQSCSLRFEVANVDFNQLGDFLREQVNYDWKEQHNLMRLNNLNGFYYGELINIMNLAYANGDVTELDCLHFQVFSLPNRLNCLVFNCPEVGSAKDVTENDFISSSMIEGRKSIQRLFMFCRKYLKGFDNAFISNVSSVLGIRQSRKLDGMYTLTKEDVANYRKHDDSIAVNNYPIDIHGSCHEVLKYKEDIDDNEKYYDIPYGVIVPKQIKNLLVAGRSSSFDFMAQSSARVQYIARALGEAAGIAAAIQKKEGFSFQKIDGRVVHDCLEKRGMIFPKK